jgi:hypothetical protein
MNITKEQIERGLNNTSWDFMNKVFYEMCKTQPSHKDPIIASNKIHIIGRSYSAQVDRIRDKTLKKTNFITDHVGPAMVNSDLDKELTKLSQLQLFTEEGISQAIVTHKTLVDLLIKVTGLNNRSLASKYLHFHQPNFFFIYDSLASKNLNKLVRKVKDCPDIKADYADTTYLAYYRRCLSLKKEIESILGREVSIREMDKILLYLN